MSQPLPSGGVSASCVLTHQLTHPDKQYGDWLDPKAPPSHPAHGMTDPFLVANAYLVYVTRLVSRIAEIIGRTDDAESYRDEYSKLQAAFHDEYVSPSGRLVSDTQTGLALALHFDILLDDKQRKNASERLDWLIRWDSFKVSTGFAGTPIILDTLAEVGKLDLAYRMLQERDNPSWLYPVTMGATTIVSVSPRLRLALVLLDPGTPPS
jgi:alpha-L-rhamnosidase